MTAALTTLDIVDGDGTTRSVRAWDESGSGAGPFWFINAGDAASQAADVGNPVKIGAKAKAALSGLTLVAADNRVNAHADLDGALIVRQGKCLGDLVRGRATDTAGSSTSLIGAQGASIKTYLTDVTFANSSGTNITVNLLDGASLVYTFPVPANSGVTHRFESPLAGSANTAWNFQGSGAVTTLTGSASGFKSKI